MKIKRFIITSLFLLFYISSIFPQSKQDKDAAVEIAMKAIKIMDEGKYNESIKLLEKSIKLDPERIDFPYEKAYAQYRKKDFKSAIKNLNNLTKHKDVNDRVFQLLGNCYDEMNNPDKAIKTYKKGLKKFPNSGKLFTELGILEYNRGNYNLAIEYWEKGIDVEPIYASNYYWLGKVFSYSEERIWSILYSEMFINLERNSIRTVEISKLLYDTYKESIIISSDSVGKISFSKANIIGFSKNKLQIPFPITFGLTMSVSLSTEMLNKKTEFSILLINNLRQSFIKNWYEQKRNKKYPNVIFDFQKQLKEKSFFESYNYWLFMKGDEIEFNKWKLKNQSKFNEFIDWFSNNPIEINNKNYFSRNKY